MPVKVTVNEEPSEEVKQRVSSFVATNISGSTPIKYEINKSMMGGVVLKYKDNEACGIIENPGIYGIRDLLNIDDVSSNTPNSYEKEKALDLLNAYTYYYLAQVYQKLEEPKKSAECCHISL